MTVLSSQRIRTLCIEYGMILPFVERTRYEGITHGLSSAGYDVRVEFDREGTINETIIEPGGFLLVSTIERFRMPNYLVGIVHDKSSWARQGLTVQNTVIEPGWEGWLTLELANHGPRQILLKRSVGIAQILFHKLDEATQDPYEGKYQNQERGPVREKDGN